MNEIKQVACASHGVGPHYRRLDLKTEAGGPVYTCMACSSAIPNCGVCGIKMIRRRNGWGCLACGKSHCKVHGLRQLGTGCPKCQEQVTAGRAADKESREAVHDLLMGGIGVTLVLLVVGGVALFCAYHYYEYKLVVWLEQQLNVAGYHTAADLLHTGLVWITIVMVIAVGLFAGALALAKAARRGNQPGGI